MTTSVFIAWRSGDDAAGRWGPVARVDHEGDVYRFVYTKGARSLEGFQPFVGMNELETVYESAELFPLLANRLLAKSRPEYEAYLTWGGFDPDDPPEPLALLGVTEGRRQTDSVEVFPCPLPDATGCYLNKFFLHGVRWMPPAALERIARLQSEEELGLMLDISNKHDPYAVAVRTNNGGDRCMIGYVPRYLAKDVWQLCAQCQQDFVALHVERVNPDAPLQQRVLCRMNACWPEDFRPCSGEEFQPIVDVPLRTPGVARA